MKTNNSKENLCDTCNCVEKYPECSYDEHGEDIDLDLHFGNSIGNDNIINCNGWEGK